MWCFTNGINFKAEEEIRHIEFTTQIHVSWKLINIFKKFIVLLTIRVLRRQRRSLGGNHH